VYEKKKIPLPAVQIPMTVNMKALLKRRKELTAEHDLSIRASDLSREETRRKHYDSAGIIIEQQMAIDHALERIRQQLCEVILVKGLKDVQRLSEARNSEQLNALLHILTKISEDLFGEGIDLDELHAQFADYLDLRRQAGDTQVPDYAADVDRIKSDGLRRLKAFCDQHRVPSPV
jgi:hypothetical protein